jgi:hypothetical protein
MLYLTYNFYTILVLKLLAIFSIGIYLDIAMKRGYLGYWVLNKFLASKNKPSIFYNKVSVIIFCFYVISGIVQSILLIYIDDSNMGISIICNSNDTSSTSTQRKEVAINEEAYNNTANVNIETVGISNVNIPASAIITAANAIVNGAIVVTSIKAAAKISQSAPSIGGKFAVIISGIVFGAAAIALKNVVSDPSILGNLKI